MKELWLSQKRKLGKISSKYINTWWGVKKTEADYSQKYLVPRQEALGTTETENSIRNHCFTVWVVQRGFGVTILGYSKPDWTQPFATHSSWPCLSRDWTKGSQESHTHLNNSVKIQLDCPTWKLEWGQLYLSTHWITVNRATVLVLWTHVTVEDLLTVFGLLQAALCMVPGIMRR